MRKGYHSGSRAGFSLMEIILVLLLIGIIGVFAVPLFSRVVVASVQGGVEQQTAEETYWAAARMTSILGVAVSGSCPTPQQVTAGIYDSATGTTNLVSFTFNNRQVMYNGVLFWDQVHAFSASYANRLFQITVQLVDASHPSISVDVFARNAP